MTPNSQQSELLRHIQSPKPARYQLLRADGSKVHVFCAYDALLYVALTGKEVPLEAWKAAVHQVNGLCEHKEGT
ncbi:hypothetical protein [Calidithermus roseus]|uniref:Uncharacterized protein n=1 Tax=Calidithermus roseus TaxID=1644118 RepID=A0A399F1K1_9DEIN|nr:hypothetical protein [Calidithermus roseus]RIH89566.1 hypothetical protein Mrose_00154 [Calidithermus roseus]